MGWKVALNLLEAASGIATRTYALVEKARASNPDHRGGGHPEGLPGTKAVATKAVYAGGGLPHRLGLSESVLVFAQHVAFLEASRTCGPVCPRSRTGRERRRSR